MPDTTEAHEVGELLPCPLCGYGAEPEMDEDFETWGVRCGDYQCGCKIDGFVSKELARDTWNSRSVTSEAGVREATPDAVMRAAEDALWQAMVGDGVRMTAEDRLFYGQVADAVVGAYRAALAADASRSPRPAEASAPVAEGVREAMESDTDGAKPRDVLWAMLRCANAWEPEVRILGNVRASDMRRAIEAALAASPAPASEPSRAQSDELRCPVCDCHTLSHVDEQKADGHFAPGPLVRCVNCKREFDRAALSRAPTIPSPAPAGAEVSEADVLREALRAADDALVEAEAVLGGEYADTEQVLYDRIQKFRAVLRAADKVAAARDGRADLLASGLWKLACNVAEAALAVSAGVGATAPVGWRLVPEEPTLPMLADALSAFRTTHWHDLTLDEIDDNVVAQAFRAPYAAMLAAAPPAPVPSASLGGDDDQR